MSARTLLLDLAARGARFPIGTDLVLSEQAHPEAIKLDGAALGRVMVESARRWNTPLAVPLMDLAVEKEWLGLALGVARDRVDGWHLDGVIPTRLPSAPPTPRLAANAAAIRHVAEHSDRIPCGMCIGPFSLMTKLVSDLITAGDFGGVREAMEKSLAEGSQTFEQDLARLITDGTISRDEGLAFADSPTNLLWRLQNDMSPVSRITAKKEEVDEGASFTEITLDVRPEASNTRASPLSRL